jgi:L-Ala-D/L-Glu epimerase
VEARTEAGVVGYGEACPRPYVTGETLETTQAFFSRHEGAVVASIGSLESLRSWMADHERDIDDNPAAWCAIELAILDAFAKEQGQTVEGLLSLPSLQGEFRYTAVLGDAGAAAFRAMAEQYAGLGFTDFKVKVSGDPSRDAAKIDVLRNLGRHRPIRVRVDANNLWKGADEAIPFLRALDYPFFAIEEPLGRYQFDELVRIAAALECRIVLDESVLRTSHLDALADSPRTWLINLRVSKMGGLLRSLDVVAAARRAGIPLIVGAQVGETSLLTRAALTVAHVSRDLLMAQEGAFGTQLLERDICDPPLMFGAGGVLDVARFPRLIEPGFGIRGLTIPVY